MILRKYTDIDEWLSSKGFLKVISFLLALALWGYVVGDRNEEMIKEFEVRLDFLNPPSGLMLAPSSRSVFVTLMGERRVISSLDSYAMASDVDLRGLSSGRYQLPVRFSAPPRTRVTQMTPSSVDVELFRVVEKRLPVRVQAPEDMPDGYVMDGTSVSPETVLVLGREDILNSMDAVTVSPSVEQLAEGGAWIMQLHGPAGSPEERFQFSPSEVTVSASYFQAKPRKNVPVHVDLEGELPSGLTLRAVSVDPSEISVEGPADVLRGLHVLDTEPLDLSSVNKSDSYPRRITSLPAGLSLLDSPLVRINVTIESQRVSRTLSAIPVEIEGGQASDWRADPRRVSVSISGSPEAMGSLDLEKLDLQVYVDVTNVVAPSLRLPLRVRFNKDSGVDLVETDPSTVTVRALAH